MSGYSTNRVPVRAIHHFAYKCRNAEETLVSMKRFLDFRSRSSFRKTTL